MKAWAAGLCAAMLSVSAMGQFAGLPVAGGAAAPAAGAAWASAGAVLGDDFNLYGARISFAPVPRLALFADLGAIDPDGGDTGPSAQGGAQFTLPLGKEMPVDVAVRATWGYAQFDFSGGDLEMGGFCAGAVASRKYGSVEPYAFAGLNFVDTEVKAHGEKSTDDETDLAVAFGVALGMGERFSLYGEMAHVDDFFMNFGARWNF